MGSSFLKISAISVFIFAFGCTTVTKKTISPGPVDPVVRAKMEQDLKSAEEQLKEQKYNEALEAFKKFGKDNPVSIFTQRALIGEARALEGLNEWTKAAAIYSNVISDTRETNPDVAALALYWSSFCYEALGDEARVIAALLDAYKMAEYLPAEKGKAEVPARLAAAYARIGNEEESRKYLQIADKGISSLFGNKSDTPEMRESKSEIYYLMGHQSTAQLSEESLGSYLETLNLLQVYLLRGVELEGTKGGEHSQKQLMAQYRDLWVRIDAIRAPDGYDPVAGEVTRRQAKSKWAAELLDSVERLRQYRLPTEKGKLVEELFSYLEEFENKAKQAILAAAELSPLTK